MRGHRLPAVLVDPAALEDVAGHAVIRKDVNRARRALARRVPSDERRSGDDDRVRVSGQEYSFPRLVPARQVSGENRLEGLRPGLDADWYVHIMYINQTALESQMAAAVERIVVQATAQEKKAIAAKAKRLGLPISELMRRGARAYESAEADEELGALADAATGAAERAGASIDSVLEFIEASNRRIAALEAKAKRSVRKTA